MAAIESVEQGLPVGGVDEEIDVACVGPPWLIPLQPQANLGRACGNRHPLKHIHRRPRIEVVQKEVACRGELRREAREVCRGHTAKVGSVAVAAEVACRGEVGHAGIPHSRVDGEGNDAILKPGRPPFGDVVDDDLAASGNQLLDAVGKHRRCIACGGEKQRRSRRDRVHQLGHRPALVAARLRLAVFDRDRVFLELHNVCRERSGGDIEGIPAEVVEAVGDHADLDAAAVDAKPRPGEIRLKGKASLVDEAAVSHRLNRRIGKGQGFDGSKRVDRPKRQPGREVIAKGHDLGAAETSQGLSHARPLPGLGQGGHRDALAIVPAEQFTPRYVGRRAVVGCGGGVALVVGRNQGQQVANSRLHSRVDRHQLARVVVGEARMAGQQLPRLKRLRSQRPGILAPPTATEQRPNSSRKQ